jgi:ADP-ribose pyrophosphatase YjhB (NUDIX family)
MLHGWRYCPRCRAELHLDGGRARCEACGFVAYANSAPTASALVLDADGRVLLGRRKHEPYAGRWDIPGGFLEEGEHPLAGLVRELKEETGLDVQPLDLFAIEIDRYGEGEDAQATLNLYWTARAAAGEPQAADDVTELRWFAARELPPRDELAFDNIAKVLEAFRNGTLMAS